MEWVWIGLLVGIGISVAGFVLDLLFAFSEELLQLAYILMLVGGPLLYLMWGLRRDEVMGRHFLNLDIGLKVDELLPCIRSVLGTESDEKIVTLDATNRRGKSIVCRVSCHPLGSGDKSISGVVLLMDENESSKTPE